MKKSYFFCLLACLLAACSADESIVKGDGLVMDTHGNVIMNLKYSDNVVGDFNGGKMGVKAIDETASRAIGSRIFLKCENDELSVPATAENLTWEYVNLICNTATGLSHGDNGYAVKSKASGSLDNNRRTYSWFYNDKGEKQNWVQNDQGLLLTGLNCDLSELNDGGRPVVYVGNEWFSNSFAMAQQFIDEAMSTEAKTAYYQLQNGGDNLDFPYTYYDYKGYRVVIQEYDLDNGSIKDMADNAKAPWAEGHGDISWPTDGDTNTMDHNVIVVTTKDTTYFNGRNIDAHIFAPGKNISIAGGGAPCGIIVCDHIDIGDGTEIHGVKSETFGFTPVEVTSEECEASTVIKIDIPGDYVVVPDDFAIHNGHLLYENAAISSSEGVTDGEKACLKVTAGKSIEVALEDLCELYPTYVNKMNDEGKPYISEDGVLTLEVYIWPGTIVNEKFIPYKELGEGYIIGDEKKPVEYAPNNKHYSVLVSAFKGYQGTGGATADDVKAGWSYIKVSIHIKPRF